MKGVGIVDVLCYNNVRQLAAAITPKTKIIAIANPNSPSGSVATREQVLAITKSAPHAVVLVDEAYFHFYGETILDLVGVVPNLVVARTFSKGYSLCYQRVGYFVGPPALVAALDKIRDSYNVNGLGQVAALATLEDLPYYRKNFRKIIATRRWLSGQLRALGFLVLPSETNFIFARTPRLAAREWLARWRERKILVRWFDSPATRDYVRITIGTDAEARAVVRAAKDILG